jgi:hypothetical protein
MATLQTQVQAWFETLARQEREGLCSCRNAGLSERKGKNRV